MKLFRRLFARAQKSRKGLPRLPTSDQEWQGLRRTWNALNGRYYFIADVTTRGNRFSGVTFDADTNVAVERIDPAVFGSLIDSIHIKEAPGRPDSAFVPCPGCGSLLAGESLISSARGYWAAIDVTLATCERCHGSLELQVWPGIVRIGYTYAAGAPHFSPVLTVEVPNLLRRIRNDTVEIDLDGQTWTIAGIE